MFLLIVLSYDSATVMTFILVNMYLDSPDSSSDLPNCNTQNLYF